LRHIRVIAPRVGAIVPGLPSAGLRAVAIAGIVAVIAVAGIVAVISIVGIIAVIPVIVVGIAVTPPGTPPIGRVDPAKPKSAAETPKAMVEPAKPKAMVEPAAAKPSKPAVEPSKPAAVEPSKPAAMKPSTPAAAMSGIGHLWLNNGGSKQQCC